MDKNGCNVSHMKVTRIVTFFNLRLSALFIRSLSKRTKLTAITNGRTNPKAVSVFTVKTLLMDDYVIKGRRAVSKFLVTTAALSILTLPSLALRECFLVDLLFRFSLKETTYCGFLWSRTRSVNTVDWGILSDFSGSLDGSLRLWCSATLAESN